MHRVFFILTGLIFAVNVTVGQISEGGKPLETNVLKSAGIPVKEMPPVNNTQLVQQYTRTDISEPRLKPVHFAHAFEVNFTPENSGTWLDAGNGYLVWKLKIRSEGAKSINLIFHNFNLPQGARLFLYNNDQSHLLGAFTSYNNKPSGKFAVSPIAGDEITVQYEVPKPLKTADNFIIAKVNHDFLGILKYDERRPLNKTAGECNIDVNCDVGKNKEVKDAVCRLIVNGSEICTGTLVNNVAEDNRPYIISAAHCYDKWEYAETTVYTFNYESPYCAPLDGDPSQSVSGAIMKAQFDSLDFALAEMTLVPPPEYHPYFAGWDRQGKIPDSTFSIHHPQGDIKKIAYDNDPPQFSGFNNNYISNGFFKVLRWEGGVTENGSSGGPLFDHNDRLIGTLTGGLATCSNPVKDYFSRFDLAWNFKSDSTKQLKCWLDPFNTGSLEIDGKRPYSDENLCGAFTNLDEQDIHSNVPITNFGEFEGYWGGTNNVGITEFTERFSVEGNEQLSGVSLGVGKIKNNGNGTNSIITVKVYNGGNVPKKLIYSDDIRIKDLAEDAMNLIGFNKVLMPADTFFVGFELSNMQPLDSFVLYQSLRSPERENNFFFKQDGAWQNFKNANVDNYSMSNVMELLLCNINENATDSPLINNTEEILIYPNPVQSDFTLESAHDIKLENIAVFNLIGQQVEVQFSNLEDKKVRIDLSGNVPGIYFVRLKTEKGSKSTKISFVPW